MDKQLIQRANAGDAEAQYKVARGCEKKLLFKEARAYYLKAAKQSYPKAYYRIAQMYKAGRSVAFDAQKSAGFMKVAADNGVIKAQYYYGRMLYYGFGVEQNKSLAIDYFGSAANQGHKDAQIVIGKILAKGEGELAADVNQAAGYLYAASSDNAEAKYKLGKLLMKSPELGASPEPYLREAAEMGHVKAKYYYGMMLAETDWEKSLELLKESAECNYAKAQFEYGAKLHNLQENEIDALKYLRMAAAKGNENAQMILDSIPVDDQIVIPNDSDNDDLYGSNIKIPGIEDDEEDVHLNITIIKPSDPNENDDESNV